MVAGSSPAAPATSYFAFSATNLYILKKILQDLTMRALHADVLSITQLKLNSHFAPETSEPEMDSVDHSEMPIMASEQQTEQLELLTLPYQLHADLLLLQPAGFAEIIKGDRVKLQNNVLTLPSVNLTVEHKRALWKLLHDK
ncbi:hypothetical protein CWB73_07330 [Pseudoalteromonas phenolica]|uniref:Uncharacterized protein n=2 Tax=Pseudoalteromonas phenolica TaxID=161398 RepID=A0A5S3YUJ8_9GAMM|nr:hypothetical protein CWB73_07330 [Pseudoalteromonas phenolica]